MGGKQSEPMKTSKRTAIHDSRYGGLIHLSPNTATVYQQLHTDEKGHQSLLNLILKRKAFLHPNLLTVRNHFVKQQKSSTFVCGPEQKVQVYLEYSYLTRTLEDVIEEHSVQDKIIPEQELVRIFTAVVEALAYLAKQGTCHGDVKASTVLFDHLGTPKLIDSYFISGGKTAYEIVLQNPSSMSLLAPEQLQRIKHRQFEDLSTIHMSEIFAVGLTMLEAMTFETAMECYNLQTLELVEGYQERKEQELRSGPYSKKICDLVMRCIRTQATARPSFGEFLGALIGR